MVLRVFLIILFTAMTVFSQNPSVEPGISQSLAKWRAARYSDVRYKLDLTLEKMSPTLKGTIEVSVKIAENSAANSGDKADSIILDWRKIRGKEDLSTVSNILLNGNPAAFQEENEHIIIRGAANGENTVRLDFTSPILTTGSAITRYLDRQDQGEYIYSLFVPSDASTAFPVFDQPDLKARFSLKITVPGEWAVVTNTRPLGFPSAITNESHDELKKSFYMYIFEETKPISTYVFAFSAGDFEVFKECLTLPIGPQTVVDCLKPGAEQIRETSQIYVRRSQAEKFKQHAKEVFHLNREGVKFLESYFDYKFPFPKYDLVLIPEFPFGGMEHAGATFLREEAVIFPQEPTANNYISRANLIFHEAAHQWFGDTVTMRWFDDLWLKEGFAEFMAYKTLEKVMP
jgi:aminopeptidase N